MKNKIIIIGVIIVAIIFISLLNMTVINNITGYSITEIGNEFPGLGIFLVLLFCAIGILAITKMKNK